MNRPFTPADTSSSLTTPCSAKSAPAVEVGGRGEGFQVRQVECGCADGYMNVGGFLVLCDECEGAGEVDAACADCSVIRPINDDGLCRSCAMANLGPAEIAALHLTAMQSKEAY